MGKVAAYALLEAVAVAHTQPLQRTLQLTHRHAVDVRTR
eukprot:COSAG04_NODE_7065_length_1198_cov_1.185623_1_plen_38_part_10